MPSKGFEIVTKRFHGNPEGYKITDSLIFPVSGNYVKFEKATDKQIMELLNFWNDNPLSAGSVNNWIKAVEGCKDLLDDEKLRLARLAGQSKYWLP